MFSRAHLLIQRDYEGLLEDKPWGIDAQPLTEDNIFEWTAQIAGLNETPWQGGIFRLYIKFNEHYNSQPPEICFHTIPFHPNVDAVTGKPCVNLLMKPEEWREAISITDILIAIQNMLSEPLLTEAVNQEALDLLLYSPHAYNQMVQSCVAASLRVNAGADHDEVWGSKKEQRVAVVEVQTRSQAPRTALAPAAKVSFEDYHSSWKGLATSKNKSAESGKPNNEIENQKQKTYVEEKQRDLLYGRFNIKDNQPKLDEKLQAKLDHVNKMRRFYMHPRSSRMSPSLHGMDSHCLKSRQNQEEWEDEVDDLVKWTNSLDDSMI